MSTSKRKLQQCDFCGTLMSNSLHGGVCADCMEEDKELYDKARNFLKFGEKVLAEELAQKSGVDLKHIQRWISIGRLSIQ
tara:strand:- start:27 stop:266 length:240 start_codon:yes stop_codon:yes gene_type:complete